MILKKQSCLKRGKGISIKDKVMLFIEFYDLGINCLDIHVHLS